jgi:hypothetical protein
MDRCANKPHGQGHCGQPTILENRGPVKLDHDLIRILVFLHVTHFAQVLGLHQRIVLTISLIRRGWVLQLGGGEGGRTQ